MTSVFFLKFFLKNYFHRMFFPLETIMILFWKQSCDGMDPQPLLVTSFTHMFSEDPASPPVAPSPRASGLEARSAVAPIPWFSVSVYVGVSPVLYIPHSPAYSGSGFLVLQVTVLFAPSTPDPAEGQSSGQSSLPGATHGCQACRDTASSVFSAEFEATAAWPTLPQASPLQTLLECQTWQLLCLWKKLGETLS